MISKDLKIFLRNRASLIILFMSLFLLLFLLIFLFNHSEKNLVIAYYEPSRSNLSTSIKNILKDQSINLVKFNDNNSCIESVKKSMSNLCVIFPENLTISENYNGSIKFVIDQSKINLAYYLLDKINSQFSSFTKSKQTEYIDSILESYNLSVDNISKALSLLDQIKEEASKTKNDITHIRLLLSQIDTSSKKLDASKLKYSAYDLINRYNFVMDLTKQTLSLFDDIYDDVDELNKQYNFTEQQVNLSKYKQNYQRLHSDLLTRENDSNQLIQPLIDNVNAFSHYYTSSQSQLETIEQKKKAILSDLERIESKINATLNLTYSQSSLLVSAKRLYDNLPIKETTTLVEPIKTEILPLFNTSSEFVILPSIFSLLIIFSALLFSSSIVVSNNLSRGRLREILSKKKKSYFYLSSFISSWLIVLLELATFVIFISFPLSLTTSQFLMLLLLLFISTPLFLTIGILIGNLSSSKETAAFFSLVLSIIFIIVSGDLVPVEFFPKILKNTLPYIPYEMFKRASFNIIVNNFSEAFNFKVLLMLFLYTLIFFILSYLTFKQGVFRNNLFRFILNQNHKKSDKKTNTKSKKKIKSNAVKQ
ncbi:MAG: type transport system permease protein [Candidatus Woesearchaeota archaeon]|nr:type transport system permease protein [Candidatus Woesearchaeota archaeon]MDN5327774.1 type transport system permease protein [Candidatus Woesearchaeota archaeon]